MPRSEVGVPPAGIQQATRAYWPGRSGTPVPGLPATDLILEQPSAKPNLLLSPFKSFSSGTHQLRHGS